MTTQTQVDGFLLSRRNSNEIMPSSDPKDFDTLPGGMVFPPTEGRKDWVITLDIKSLYPSSIITANISPECMCDRDESDIIIPEVPLNPSKVPGNEIKEKHINWYGDDSLPFNFNKEGIIPKYLKEIFRERDVFKLLRSDYKEGDSEWKVYDQQQYSVKVLMNSIFGVMGNKYFRLSSKEMGGSIMAISRYVLWKSSKIMEDIGYDSFYADSVTGDRNVVVRNPNNQTKVISIEKLFDKAQSKKSFDSKDRYKLDGWKALSMNKYGNGEWKPIEGIIRHKTDKELVRMQHRYGESVTTKDHSYVKSNLIDTYEVSPEELDYPQRVNKPQQINSDNKIDVYDYLKNYRREGNDVGRGYNEVTHQAFCNEEWVWLGTEDTQSANGKVKVKRYIEKGSDSWESLLTLFGGYIPEGSSSTYHAANRYGATISESSFDYLDRMKKAYDNLFDNVNCNIINQKIERDNYIDRTKKLNMMNELSAVFFKEFCGQKSYGKKLPDFVYDMSYDDKEYLLNILVEGDGSRKFPRYSEDYHKNHFSYTTISQDLASGLSYLLLTMNKKYSIGYREEKGSYSIRTCNSYAKETNKNTKEVSLSNICNDDYEYVYDLSVKDNHNFIDALGCICLHNTDSLFIQYPNSDKSTTVDDVVDWGEDLCKELNKRMDEVAESLDLPEVHPYLKDANLHGNDMHCWVFEFETVYRRWIQTGNKKRYSGIKMWDDGDYYRDITKAPQKTMGYEAKRSSTPIIGSDMQKKVLRMILEDKNYSEISDYISKTVKQVENLEYELSDIGKPTSITKPLEEYGNVQHIRACRNSNKYIDGVYWRENDSPFLFYIKSSPFGVGNIDVISLPWNIDKLPELYELNIEKHIEKSLIDPLEPILEEMGWKFRDLRTSHRTQDLDLGSSKNTSNPFLNDNLSIENKSSHNQDNGNHDNNVLDF